MWSSRIYVGNNIIGQMAALQAAKFIFVLQSGQAGQEDVEGFYWLFPSFVVLELLLKDLVVLTVWLQRACKGPGPQQTA